VTDPIRDRLERHLRGRYAIESELGQGGMATVYLAMDLRHHRRVALKVLRPGIVLGAERFLREIQRGQPVLSGDAARRARGD
jgi:serine/threonine-protein kinase